MVDSKSDDKVFFTRRRIVKGIGVSAGAGTIGAAGLFYGSQPVLATHGSLSADALGIDANDEAVTEVTITPSLTLEWSNFSSGVSGFDITVQAAPSGGTLADATALTGVSDDTSSGVTTFSGTLTSESGSATVDLSGIPLVDGGNGPISTSDLPNSVGDGESVTNSLDLEITATANSASGGGSAVDTTPTTTFDVTLNNTAGDTTTSGNVSTSGTTE